MSDVLKGFADSHAITDIMKWSLRKSYREWMSSGREHDAEQLAEEAMREYQYDLKADVVATPDTVTQ